MKGWKWPHYYTKPHLTECETGKERGQRERHWFRKLSLGLCRPICVFANATINENHEDRWLVNSLWLETLSLEYSNWGLSLESGNSSGTQWSTSCWLQRTPALPNSSACDAEMQHSEPNLCTCGGGRRLWVCNALHWESCDWIRKRQRAAANKWAKCGDWTGEICQRVELWSLHYM